MRGQVYTYISKDLYNLIKDEKEKLKRKEEKKVKSRRKNITLIIASRSIARKAQR